MGTAPILTTPLHSLHKELGGKLVPFAGYDMPVQFKGILAEHNHTREAAGLFDVSHMGQAFLKGPDHATAAAALEKLVPGDIKGLAPGAMRYTLLLNEQGGILDDLMVTRAGSPEYDGWLFLVVNAACKDADFAHIAKHLPAGIELDIAMSKALIALQGPKAVEVLKRHVPEAAKLVFMTGKRMTVAGIEGCIVTRSGYTGEDGFEISVPADDAEKLARLLLNEPEVEPIGLGARDSLRLEAGLCLYGHDIDIETTPIEAALTWVVSKERREDQGFPGAAKIIGQIANGVTRKRVGILPEGRAPAREGTAILDKDGNKIGVITSGGFGPTVGGPVAMGYVASEFAKMGTEVGLEVRGKVHPARVAKMPFAPHRYVKEN